MPSPGGTIIDVNTIPSTGMYVIADFEMGDGISLTGWKDSPGESHPLMKTSGPTIFHLVKLSSPDEELGVSYAVYAITESSNIVPGGK